MTDSEPAIVDLDTPEATPDISLAAVRDLVLRAHPNVVPELVTGDSLEALLDSIGPATAAYDHLAERLQPAPPTVPAGASTPAAVDPERIPTSLKIQLGLRNRAPLSR